MDDLPRSQDVHSSGQSTQVEGGFKAFWRKTASASPRDDLAFAEQDPSSKKKESKISRLFGRKNTRSSACDGNLPKEKSKATSQKRREQVYQAQKRHRNRQTEYVKDLEREIANLQHEDSVARREIDMLALQNDEIRKLLASHSVDAQLDSLSLTVPPTEGSDQSNLDSAMVDIRWDSIIGHDRVFLDMPVQGSSEGTVSASDTTTRYVSTTPAGDMPPETDAWAALDFILALEHPCLGHTFHSKVNPSAVGDISDKPDLISGHTLTMQAAVFESALPPSNDPTQRHARPVPESKQHNSAKEGAANHWYLSYSEIEKLVSLSEQLPLEDSEMTPARAYAAVREIVPAEDDLRPILSALKGLLAPHCACLGFGAVMPAIKFYENLDQVLCTLGSKSRES